MELIRSALMYLGLGWSVVPVHTPLDGGCSCGKTDCPSPGKHPRVRWQAHVDAPTTVDEVRAWWRRWPEANIGVLTGSVSGVAVVDIDPRNGGDVAFDELAMESGGFPDSVETQTGGGGRHLWFSTPPAQTVASTILGPGLELKASGALVVVPPSLHESGSRYVWRPGHEPWTMTPAALPTHLVRAASTGSPRVEDGAPARTEHERAEFAALWEEVGLVLEPGDRYYPCPFHDDVHPSLHVDAEGCRWYCFGCRRGGGAGMLRRLLGHGGPTRHVERLTGQVGNRRPVALRGPVDVDVVGESRHQDELLEIVGGFRPYGGVDATAVAELVFDPANPHDPDAVEIVIDARPVGFLRHQDAVAYRALIDDSLDLHGFATCWAHIRGGWDRGHDDVGALGVTLELPAPDDL